MIHSVSADRPSFKTVNFKSGLNVVLAERTQQSTGKDSRNGLGKSALIDILHFCLGSNKQGTLCKKELDGWTFTMVLDIDGRKHSVSRNTANPSKIFVDGSMDWHRMSIGVDGNPIFTNTNWKKDLSTAMFGMRHDYEEEYDPTFRSLISYFIRRDGQSGGYLNPFRHSRQQRDWDIQVNCAYLLGLGWEFASQKQILRDREAALRHIKKSAIDGTLFNIVGDAGKLDAERIRLEDEIKEESEHIKHFMIHEQYSQLEKEADEITGKLHDMINQDVRDKNLLKLYKSSMVEETDTDPEQIAQMYEEAEFLFPDVVTKRLKDVRQFHRIVVQNRKKFLDSEVTRLEYAMSKRNRKIKELGKNKSRILGILETHGALEEFLQIQQNHQRKVGELEDIINRLKILKEFESEKDSIKIDSAILRRKMESDLTEREAQRRIAIRAFNSYSERLYEASGTLSISALDSGYSFDVEIERSGSHGYENMKIFCYDMTLAKLWARRQKSPGFLVHDSSIFADVDERQIAHALRLAAEESEEHEYQYICTLNSDSVPKRDLGPDFDFDSHVAIMLTDATEDGGLLGIRF